MDSLNAANILSISASDAILYRTTFLLVSILFLFESEKGSGKRSGKKEREGEWEEESGSIFHVILTPPFSPLLLLTSSIYVVLFFMIGDPPSFHKKEYLWKFPKRGRSGRG
jgi:hypothetical protein